MKKKILLFIHLGLSTFIFSQSLVSIAPDSAASGQTLNVTITGSGTNFNQSSSTVSFSGGGVSVNSVTVISTTSIQASISVNANAVTGDYDVSVGSYSFPYVSLPGAFHIKGVPPVILDSITPAFANVGQTLEVTITGINTHFSQATSTVSFTFNQGTPTTITADSVTVLSNTAIKANVTIPSNAPIGFYDLIVTNSIDGVKTMNNIFEVKGLAGPALVSVDPDSVSNGQTLSVTITGSWTHFNQASPTSVSFGGGIIVNSTTILNDTVLQSNVTVPANIITGNYNVSIYNSIDGNRTLYNAFHVQGLPPPTLYSITPGTANSGQTLNVTITGFNTHFKQASTLIVTISGGIVVNSTSVVGDSTIDCIVTVPANTNTGNYNVSVYNTVDGSLALYNAFHVNGTAASFLSSIFPNTANSGQTLNVTIIGVNTHFNQASPTVVTFGGGIVVNSVSVFGDSAVTCNITVPTNVYSGYYNVTVNNSVDGNLTMLNAFHINGLSNPTLVLISPSGSKQGQTLSVTITGSKTHFSQVSGTLLHFTFNQASSTIIVNSTTVLNDSTINANITIPLSANLGTYKAIVNNSLDGSINIDFNVYDQCLSYFSTNYNSVTNTFMLGLDSISSQTGFGFLWSFGDGTTSIQETPSHTFSHDTLYNVCLRISTPLGDTCSYCHIIGKDSIGNPVLKKAGGFSVAVVRYNGTLSIPDKNVSGDDLLISVFPNPANESINVTTKQTSLFQNTILSLYSIDGQLILKQPLKQDNMIVDIRGLAQGVYFIKVNSDDRSEMIKFAKY